MTRTSETSKVLLTSSEPSRHSIGIDEKTEHYINLMEDLVLVAVMKKLRQSDIKAGLFDTERMSNDLIKNFPKRL